MLVLNPGEARVRMREYHRHRHDKVLAELDDEAAAQAINGGPSLDELSRLPEEFSEANTVAVICDETEGLCYYADFGQLDALFANPALARDRSYLGRPREYLNDDSVSPMVIRRLVQRHPDNADAVLRALLRKPTFAWERDGEDPLRRRKAKHFAHEPLPSVTPVTASRNFYAGKGGRGDETVHRRTRRHGRRGDRRRLRRVRTARRLPGGHRGPPPLAQPGRTAPG
jgi:hypothetical protein